MHAKACTNAMTQAENNGEKCSRGNGQGMLRQARSAIRVMIMTMLMGAGQRERRPEVEIARWTDVDAMRSGKIAADVRGLPGVERALTQPAHGCPFGVGPDSLVRKEQSWSSDSQ